MKVSNTPNAKKGKDSIRKETFAISATLKTTPRKTRHNPIESSTKCRKVHEHFKRIIKSTLFTALMTALTLIILFLDDIRLAFAPKSSDEGFFVFYFITLTIFFS